MDKMEEDLENSMSQLSKDLIPLQNEEKKIMFLKKPVLLGLIIIFVVTILIALIYWRFLFRQPSQVGNKGNSIVITTPPNQKNKKSPVNLNQLEEIVGFDEKISSSQKAPNNNYVFVVIQKSTPIANTFKENKDGPVILVRDDLVFVNLINKEKKKFDLYKLVSKDIIDPLKTIPVQTQYTLYVNLLKWSLDSNNFWGAVNLVSSADPPVNNSVSLFKINIDDWSIERFALPGKYINSLGQQNLNLERNAVLFESATPKNELFLYLYEIPTQKKTTIVSYPSNIFSKYLPGNYGFLGYFHPGFLKVEPRQLNAKWLDKNTVSYIDFVTREEVIRKIQ